jgi:hypothetical protein
MTERNFGQASNIFIAEVSDVNDPHKAGRVRVRIYGRHDDKTNIPDSSLPFAQVIQPVTSAANGRMGTAPVGLVVGSKVIGMWVDADQQLPVILGTVGRAGDPIEGRTENGAPAINTETGSIPGSSQGSANNPYSALNSSRVTIGEVDGGQANITSVTLDTGGELTVMVEKKMQNAALPTVASYDKDSKEDVLDIVKAVDPLGTLASLPCLNSNLLSINSILSFLGGIVGGIVSGIVNSVVQGIRNALLQLAQKIGIFKLLGILNSAISNVKAIQDLINALNIKICGVNLINQGLFDTANFVMASVIGGLNTAVGSIVGGLNTVLDTATGAVLAGADAVVGATNTALNGLVNSVAAAPAAAIATLTSAKPIASLIKTEVPASYIQQYYKIDDDPYPGYIEWKDASGKDDPVYTLRNGEPNYVSAKQHTEFAVQNHFAAAIGSRLLSGQPITFDTLTRAISGTSNFAQGFALSRVLGAGFSTANVIGVAAALIPTVVSTVKTVYEPSAAQAQYTSGNSNRVMNQLVSSQAILARQSSLMRVGLYTPGSNAQEENASTPAPSPPAESRPNTPEENARANRERQATEQRNALRQEGSRLVGDW